jgi:branched-chain amino acid transport system ATP-binding protein
VLRVDDITVCYGKVPALQGVSLKVREGELVTLIGANGAGKTTTLRAISGLLPLAGGGISFTGRPIGGSSPRDILSLGLAHCPEGRRVFPHLTVRENLAMGAYLRRDRPGITRDLERLFDKFPRLKERLDQAAGTLSGGEQQMLAIARTLMSRPKLALFDEPSLGLAPNFVARIFEIIAEIRDEGATVLMVEQNALAALEMCDRAYLLETGRIVQHGSGVDMLANPHIRAAYLGGDAIGDMGPE